MASRPPLIIAHRGASGYRPEHTLAAYELAIEMGADFIEPDLVITRDGVLIARHENEISETTDVAERPELAERRTTKRVSGAEVTGWFSEDFTLSEIKTLRAKERLFFRDQSWNGRFEVPTLAEVLDLARRRSAESGRTIGVYPETKHPRYFRSIGLPLEERLVEVLHGAGYRGRNAPVYIQSFATGNLKALRQKTDLPLIQLLEAAGRPRDDRRTYRELATPAGLAEIATYADGIGPNKRLIVPERPDRSLAPATSLVEDAHRAGLLVHPWTLRSDDRFLSPEYEGEPEREYDQFFALGVDGVFSDFPDVALRARERSGWNGTPIETGGAMSIDVQHDPKEKKYYTVIDGHEGHVAYSETGDGKRDFHHTYVPPELRGRGVAEAVVRHALDDTRRQGHGYVATCPFVKKFIERHPEYARTSRS